MDGQQPDDCRNDHLAKRLPFCGLALPLLGAALTLGGCCALPKTLTSRMCPVSARGGSLTPLRWLVGSWVRQPGDRAQTFQEERWSSACGGMMFGQSRLVRDGKAAGFEFISLTSDASGMITYRAWPEGKQGTPFKLVELRGMHVVFENRAHDFPQRIVYRRQGDRLEAQIEGPQQGRWKIVRWSFTRRR